MHAKMPMPATVLAEIRAARCRTVATYTSFAEAKSALDYLIDHGFHEQSLAIVLTEVTDHQPMHQDTNWVLSSGQTALNGAVVGFGISFLVLMLSFFKSPSANEVSIDLAFSGMIYGAVVGAAIGLITWVFHQKPTYKNVADLATVEHFNIIAQSLEATRAQEVLFTLIQPATRV